MRYKNKAVLIPKFTMDEISGVIFGGFLMDKYINSQPNSTLFDRYVDVASDADVGDVPSISKPNSTLWPALTFSRAIIACANKGPGWHLTTPFEWASVAYLSKKLNTQPHGNTRYDATHPYYYLDDTEKALVDVASPSLGNALVGTGPNTWSHNHLATGIFDLCGLTRELIAMLMDSSGYLYIPASLNIRHKKSPYGRGVYDNSNPYTITCNSQNSTAWIKDWTVNEFQNKYVFIAESNLAVTNYEYNMYTISSNTETSLTLSESIYDGSNLNGQNVTFFIFSLIETDVTYGTQNFANVIGSLREDDNDLKALAIPAGSTIIDEYQGKLFWIKPNVEHSIDALYPTRRGGSGYPSADPAYLTYGDAGIFAISYYHQHGLSVANGHRACKAP